MAAKTVVAGSTVSASQLKDLFRQIDDGSINGRIMQAVLEHRNPWGVPTSFKVVSDGRTGVDFIADLEGSQYKLGGFARDMLRKPLIWTKGKTYKLVVIKGEEFEHDDRRTSKIRAEAEKRGYLTPPAEVAPLLRELISNEEIEMMGLFGLAVMHEPITILCGGPMIFVLDRHGTGRWLIGSFGAADGMWTREVGFLFLAPQE